MYIAKQKYDAIGNRSNRVLSFEKGEELEVLAPNPSSEWWEVSSTRNCDWIGCLVQPFISMY